MPVTIQDVGCRLRIASERLAVCISIFKCQCLHFNAKAYITWNQRTPQHNGWLARPGTVRAGRGYPAWHPIWSLLVGTKGEQSFFIPCAEIRIAPNNVKGILVRGSQAPYSDPAGSNAHAHTDTQHTHRLGDTSKHMCHGVRSVFSHPPPVFFTPIGQVMGGGWAVCRRC